MATSNWQHISYCCELLFALAPTSILDVGMGFGRWGMLAREMCDIFWRGNVFPAQWKVRIVGVEAFARLVQPYHSAFYDQVIVRDALDVLREGQQFDMVILGDVLEHFPRAQAEEVLALSRQEAYYTMLCVPLGPGWEQGALYGNPYEAHRSRWDHRDFVGLRPICWRFFRDVIGRRHAVYLFPSTHRDGRAYWQGRTQDLSVATYPEVGNLYRGEGWQGLVPALRRRLRRHPRIEAVARKAYHVLRRARGHAGPAPAPAAPRPAELPLAWEVKEPSTPVLAVVPPEWFGVTTSTRNNFPNLLLCPGEAPGPDHAAAQIAEKGFSTVVFSDVPPAFEAMARQIKARAPQTLLLVHYHGSFAQNAQPKTNLSFRRAMALARDGVVDRIGCAKAGMAEVLQAMGVRACYLPYRVEPPAPVAHHPARSPRRVGVFVRDILRKNAHTQFAAAAMLRDVEIHANDVPDLSYLPNRPPIVAHGEMPYGEFLELLGGMDLNFYVSLSECYPMVVLESLIRGVPCLTSHTHEIFEHDRELGELLIVPAHDNPVAIAEHAERALVDREAIGRRCVAYALELNRRAEALLNQFAEVALYPGAGTPGV